MRIALIHGGNSTECNVSTLNANYIEGALKNLGHKTIMLPYTKDICSHLLEKTPDAVFLCVQGKNHGDGTLQGILDHLEIPYTGSKRESATIINNKILCQKLFESEGIPIANNFIWTQKAHMSENGCDMFASKMNEATITFPCLAKAPTQGGSFGIAFLEKISDYERITPVFTYDDPILIEQFINGRFYTVGLLEYNGELLALPVLEGIALDSTSKFMSFDGKYTVAEADISQETKEQMYDYSKRAFKCVGAAGYARVDFILEETTQIPIILEINAVPGLKPSSLFPPAAKLAGIEYDDMINAVLNSSFSHTLKEAKNA